MNWVIVLLVIAAAGMVVYALARGLYAFTQMRPDELNPDGITKSHATQNRMMFMRVKYQAIAVVLLILLGILSTQA